MHRILLLIVPLTLQAQTYTRGVGKYPGDPAQNFAPAMIADTTTYRNLALHRPAWHSSAYDYNLTAQLVTDGIKDTALPRWLVTSTSNGGVLPRNERELALDHNVVSTVNVSGSPAWIQFEFAGGDGPLEVDRVDILASIRPDTGKAAGWTCIVSGSDDGQAWKELGRAAGDDRPARDFKPSIALAAPSRSRFYRIEFQAPSVTMWRVGEAMFFDRNARVEPAGPHHFTSAWKPAGTGEEWVYVDLGAPSTFDRIALSWIRRAAEGAIQVSDDAATWKTLRVPLTAAGRYQARSGRQGALRARADDQAGIARWVSAERARSLGPRRIRAASQARGPRRHDGVSSAIRSVTADGAALSKPGFHDSDWLVATVPATTLTSYLNAGAIPDPDFGDNQLMISDSFFYADFWYRTEFTAPPSAPGRHVWLNFDGINWKADVFLNGEKIGRIEGGFMRGKFDVTDQAPRRRERPRRARRKERHARQRQGEDVRESRAERRRAGRRQSHLSCRDRLGLDSHHPRPRHRHLGRRAAHHHRPGHHREPGRHHHLPARAMSPWRPRSAIRKPRRSPEPCAALSASVPFQVPVSLDASASKTVKQELHIPNPRLWWPAGYGDPNLYPVKLEFVDRGATVSDSTSFQAGIRQFTYSEEGGALRMWINGRRFIPRGGNWGFPESMLRYRAREYDIAVRYHKEMNFTMIRNWVGQTGDDAFFDACDR